MTKKNKREGKKEIITKKGGSQKLWKDREMEG